MGFKKAFSKDAANLVLKGQHIPAQGGRHVTAVTGASPGLTIRREQSSLKGNNNGEKPGPMPSSVVPFQGTVLPNVLNPG
jgi:hypothetical protein